MSSPLVWTPAQSEIVNRPKQIDIEVSVIDPYSTQLPPIKKVVWTEYDVNTPREWYYIPQNIDLGGDLIDTDFSNGLSDLSVSTDTQLIGGKQLPFLLANFDTSNTDFDKFSLAFKATIYPLVYQDCAKLVIKNTISGTSYSYGVQSLTFNPTTTPTDLNGTPPSGGNHFYFSLYNGDLYLKKDVLKDVGGLGRIRLKMFYQTIGWSL